MAYEVFAKTNVRVEEPALSLTPDGRIAINAAAARLLSHAGIKHVLLLWDKTAYRVALKKTPKGDKNAYRISFAPDLHYGSIRAKTFLSYIGWKSKQRLLIPANWDEKEGLLEIALPAEHVGARKSGKDET